MGLALTRAAHTVGSALRKPAVAATAGGVTGLVAAAGVATGATAMAKWAYDPEFPRSQPRIPSDEGSVLVGAVGGVVGVVAGAGVLAGASTSLGRAGGAGLIAAGVGIPLGVFVLSGVAEKLAAGRAS